MADVRETGFKEVTRLAEARRRLRNAVAPVERSERRPAAAAGERILAVPVDAARDVPHYARAAMDGYAVRAADTFGAGDRAPVVLAETGGSVGPDEAVRVHTGSELPAGADAVVMVEDATVREPAGRRGAGDGDEDGGGDGDGNRAAEASGPADRAGGRVEVFDAVAEGENVAPVGEDVEAGQRLFEAGHRLRPSDLGLLRAAGVGTVEVYDRPAVAVVPTGDELVGGATGAGGLETGEGAPPEPGPGEVVETNGPTVARYVERWGGAATYREVVPDEREAIRAAVERDLTADLVVTTGGSSVGERDVVPRVVDELGEVLVHGVALKPGHPVAVGVVRETPVVVLPGYPVACIVNAVQLLRPALKRTGHLPLEPHPTRAARLARKVPSEPGIRTFARVALDVEETDGEPVATPTRAAGAGVLSSVALADGWVVVEEEREGLDAGETVAVEDWEWAP